MPAAKYMELLILVRRWFGYIDRPSPPNAGDRNETCSWKGAIMLPAFTRFTRFIDNYRFYRRRGFHFREAWQLANMTLPD
jgi:hypothetical protein